ncbi:MAG: NUDIX domain-containing protein [Deltaproteobacteria bacterium]|nr:NUDIX domain-containing protein [Deltaproteobacteria bacterium]MBN2846789.1 NUDIX domain-containing protein [Deltaproteobacteria bacterium]
MVNEEYSAGAVIFRRTNEETEFLVIYSKRNGIWGFPKGHREKGETERDAAMREIFEETGLRRLKFTGTFREEDIYTAIGRSKEFRGSKIMKHSIYFLCETDTEEIKTDNSEITDYRWLPYSGAVEILPFESLKNILRKALLHLEVVS